MADRFPEACVRIRKGGFIFDPSHFAGGCVCFSRDHHCAKKRKGVWRRRQFFQVKLHTFLGARPR